MARLGGQVFEVERLTRQIETVKAALSTITIGGIVVASILQTTKTALKMYEKRSKIARNLAAAKIVAEEGARRVRTAGRTTMIQINNRRSVPRTLHALGPTLKLPRGKADDDALLARLQR